MKSEQRTVGVECHRCICVIEHPNLRYRSRLRVCREEKVRGRAANMDQGEEGARFRVPCKVLNTVIRLEAVQITNQAGFARLNVDGVQRPGRLTVETAVPKGDFVREAPSIAGIACNARDRIDVINESSRGGNKRPRLSRNGQSCDDCHRNRDAAKPLSTLPPVEGQTAAEQQGEGSGFRNIRKTRESVRQTGMSHPSDGAI